MALLNTWPMPLQAKTPSVIIAPPNKPAKSFTMSLAATIWSLCSNHQLGSSKGAPDNKDIFVSDLYHSSAI